MKYGKRIDRTNALAGVGAGAVLMIGLIFCVGVLVVRFCPGGQDCTETGQRLYGLGLLVSLAISAAFGFLVRDLVERYRKRSS